MNSTTQLQELILKERKNLKGNGVFLSESLSKTKLVVLNYAKAKFGMNSVWSSGGEIFLKTPDGKTIKLKSTNEVDTFQGLLARKNGSSHD